MKRQGALMAAVRFREILRLWWLGRSDREIGGACGCAHSTVQDYRQRAAAVGLKPEQLESLLDSEVLALLGKKGHREGNAGGVEVDWAWVSRELTRPKVTLALLWTEKIAEEVEGYSYSAFCRRFRRWEGKHDVRLRQAHPPGEKSFVDFSGMTLPYCNRESGEVYEAEIFVGSLGASNLTYVEATQSQELLHWLGAHGRMFGYFCGVTAAVVPDNLKSGVTKACRYEPELNRAYLEFAEHYGMAVLPARAQKPRDKAKVEKAVQDIQRWTLAPLRDRVFYSVAEINAAIAPLLEAFNARLMRAYGVSRRELFERIERSALKPLPVLPFQLAAWKRARVNIDYHVEYERHYYSVPYYLVRNDVEIRVTEKIVEVFFDGKRVAFHQRSRIPYQHTTLFEHMPPQHQAVRSWTKERFIAWSLSVGPETEKFVAMLFNKKSHPEQAFRSILGLQRLAKKYGSARLESASRRGNYFKLTTMRSIRSILETERDKAPLEQEDLESQPILHRNLRGNFNFH